MSLRNAPLFHENGKGTPFLFAQIRQRGPRERVQSQAVLVDGGVASRYFADWWRGAFPDRQPLPNERIADKQGRGTLRFWDVFG